MSEPKPNLRWWLWGLVAFAIVIVLSMAVMHPESVTLGIAEHQAAGSAARVDEIQGQWREGGVRTLAIIAMLGDLVFIGIYGWGSWLAGRSFMAMRGAARMLGMLIAISAITFLVTFVFTIFLSRRAFAAAGTLLHLFVFVVGPFVLHLLC